jgi:hypothetical protein
MQIIFVIPFRINAAADKKGHLFRYPSHEKGNTDKSGVNGYNEARLQLQALSVIVPFKLSSPARAVSCPVRTVSLP